MTTVGEQLTADAQTVIDASKTNSKSFITPVYNVVGYGADSTGAADSTTAIQAAMDAVGSNGGIVYFPPGTYLVTKPLVITQNGVILVGSGIRASTISLVSAIDCSLLVNGTADMASLYHVSIRDLKLMSNVNSAAYPVVQAKSLHSLEIDRCWIAGGGDQSVGLNIEGITSVSDATYARVNDCYFGLVGTGIKLGIISNAAVVKDTRIQPLSGGWGIDITSGNAITLENVSIEYPGKVSNGIRVAGANTVRIVNPRLESMVVGIQIESTAVNTLIVAPYYSSCTTNLANNSKTTVLLNSDNGDLLLTSGVSLGSRTDVDMPLGGHRIAYNSTRGAVQLRSYSASAKWEFVRYNSGTSSWEVIATIEGSTGDIFFTGTGGPKIRDRTTGLLYRIKVDNGTLGVEQV